MVPKDQTNWTKTTTPANANLEIKFKVIPGPGGATATPDSTHQSPETVGVSSPTLGDTTSLVIGIGTAFGTEGLKLSVKKYQTKTVAIHAVTQKYTTPMPLNASANPPEGKPNEVCVQGTSILWSTPGGDDQPGSGLTITTGANGVCETTADSHDTQVIPVGQGIHIDIIPHNVPTAQQLKTYLDQVFGLQTNTYLTVTRNDFSVDYDINIKNKVLDISPLSAFRTPEETAIVNAGASSTDFNIYYVQDFQTKAIEGYPSSHNAVGASSAQLKTTYVRDGALDVLSCTAHEIGHLFKIDGHANEEKLQNGSPNPTYIKGKDAHKRLMYSVEATPGPKLLDKPEWDIINPTPP